MSAVATTAPAPDLAMSDAALDAMSDQELFGLIGSCFKVTVEAMVLASRAWQRLEQRGRDMTPLRNGIRKYIPAIIAGTVLPEVVANWATEKPTLLRKVVHLTPAEQRRLVDGGTVPVVEKQNGTYTHRQLPAAALVPTQIRLVFGDGCIRSEQEQIAILSAPPPPAKPGRPVRRGRVVVDQSAKTVTISNASAPALDVIRALAEAGLITPQKV